MICVPDQDQTRVVHQTFIRTSVLYLDHAAVERCTSPKKGKKRDWARAQRNLRELLGFLQVPPEGEVGRRTERACLLSPTGGSRLQMAPTSRLWF